MQDTTARLVRGLVKTVFILCYIAFMWASIHHVAAFFNNFEADNSNQIGSYMLAGAFDITALVTTIGVMFFRKSMPGWVFWIVWAFILATAFYSFFINWEYASHYQNVTLIMQPTGEMTPVYDQAGTLHYVAVMRANTGLAWVNPLLASGFTIFSLIYSVIAEFFGTKPPTTEELQAKKQYLQETASLVEEIKQLEGKSRGPSLIQRAKETVKEAKFAVQEVLASEEDTTLQTALTEGRNNEEENRSDRQYHAPISQEHNEAATLTSERSRSQSKNEEDGKKSESIIESNNGHETASQQALSDLSPDVAAVVKRYPGVLSAWLSCGIKSVSIHEIVEVTKQPKRRVQYQVGRALHRTPMNRGKILVSSVIEWLKTAPMPEQQTVQSATQPDAHGATESHPFAEE